MPDNPAFFGRPAYAQDGDFIDYFASDAGCYAEQVDPILTVYRDIDTREIVGAKIHCIAQAFAQQVTPRRHAKPAEPTRRGRPKAGE